MPGVVPRNKFHGLYPGLTLSRHALILERVVQTGRVKTFPASCYCLFAARARGQSNRLRPDKLFSRPGTQRFEQGSNILLAAPGATPGTTNKIDQGRSLSLRAPQGCLRFGCAGSSRPCVSRPTFTDDWILPGLPEYTQASEFTSSRLPIIHLSKSSVVKVLRQQPLKVRRRSTFFTDRPARVTSRLRGSGILSIVPPLSIGPPRRFSCNLRESRSTRDALVVNASAV